MKKINALLKKFRSVRFALSVLLLLSLFYALISAYYKINYWGFSFSPKQNTNVWAIEAHISFVADGSPINVSLAIPSKNKGFKILEENIIANGYKTKKLADKITFEARNMIGEQDLYYKIMVFDNINARDKLKDEAPKKIKKTSWDETTL